MVTAPLAGMLARDSRERWL